MRFRRALSTVALTAAALASISIPLAASAAADPPRPLLLVEHYEFTISMSAFQKARNAKEHGDTLDWSSDGCSKSPDKPDGYNFLPSCQRHDFGYRNYKRLGLFNEGTRKMVDDNFKKNLYDYCSQFSGLSSWKGVECRRLADIYYHAVRIAG